MTECYHWSRTAPRALTDHHLEDCTGEDCRGCQPCEDTHCVVCHATHVTAGACPGCVGRVRADLEMIRGYCAQLPAAAINDMRRSGGVESEAAMLWGPAADPRAWRYTAEAARAGRIDATYLLDCAWERHPLWVLGIWEQTWRDQLGHDTDELVTVEGALAYLGTQLTYMSGRDTSSMGDMARDVRGCRRHLEEVLHAGDRPETGAPCPECGRALVKVYPHWCEDPACERQHYTTAEADAWVCGCGVSYTDADYQRWVTDEYRANATKLTAADLEAQYGVLAGTVMAWATRGKVRRRGRDDSGRQLYDVADVRAALASQTDTPA